MEEPANTTTDLMKPDEVATLLRVDEATLKRWRMEGKGPRWIKMGKTQNSPVRYRRVEIDGYLESLTCGPAS